MHRDVRAPSAPPPAGSGRRSTRPTTTSARSPASTQLPAERARGRVRYSRPTGTIATCTGAYQTGNAPPCTSIRCANSRSMRTDQAPVHHHRPDLGAVAVDVRQIELLRLVEVDLDGGEGRLAARPDRRSARRSSGRRTPPRRALRRTRHPPRRAPCAAAPRPAPTSRRRRRTRARRAATAGTAAAPTPRSACARSISASTSATSSPTWSSAQKLCASLSQIARTRDRPPSTPDRSARYCPPSSAMRSGRSR